MSISQPIPSTHANRCVLNLDQDNRPPRELATIVEVCRWRSVHEPNSIAFTFLRDGDDDEANLTYAELHARATAYAAALRQRGDVGDRVLILQEPGIDYIVSLFGCMYAGQIGVPVYPPELLRLQTTLPRLQAIAQDAGARSMLSSHEVLGAATGPLWSLSRSAVLPVEEIDLTQTSASSSVPCAADNIAILQYTSGSTGTPRGVAITHRNLLANLDAAYAIWDVPEAVAVFWLPPYHDMGLIGGILLPVYGGRRVVLMSPKSFLQNPVRLLKAIHKYRGTSSGSPNFGYELCVRKIQDEDCRDLDLSSWRIAVCGAEPVRAETMERFAARFRSYGFDRSAITPAYGMAESTVVISGKRKGATPLFVDFDSASLKQHRAEASRSVDPSTVTPLVGCGPVIPSSEVKIVDPDSLKACRPGQVGEVWVRGPSVAAGYWNQPELSEKVFRATITNGDGTPYLRTGDLGFEYNGELFINGRLKELIILAGQNHYPHDIERTIQEVSPALRVDCGVAFSVEHQREERLVVAQEVLRPQKVDFEQLVREVRATLAETHGIAPLSLVFVASGSLPKTSSGKLRRGACKDLFLSNELRVLHRWDAHAAAATSTDSGAPQSLTPEQTAMATIWCDVLDVESVGPQDDFLSLGGHSLTATLLLQRVREHYGVPVSFATLFDRPTLDGFLSAVNELKQQGATCEPEVSESFSSEERSQTKPTLGPLTRSQQRFWMLQQIGQQGAFNQAGIRLKLRGQFDAELWTSALRSLTELHPALRTRFIEVSGEPRQEIIDSRDVPGVTHDLTPQSSREQDAAIERLFQAAMVEPFDLQTAPLIRWVACRRNEIETELLIAWPHLICDGWSAQVLLRDLAKITANQSSQGVPDQASLIEVASREHHVNDMTMSASVEYWRQRLAGVPTQMPLPTDRPRSADSTTTASHVVGRAIPTLIAARVHTLAKQLQITDFMVHLSAWQVVLSRYTGMHDFVIGVPTANRPDQHLQQLVGCFINTVALRCRMHSDLSFQDHLLQSRTSWLQDLAHAHVPFEQVLDTVPSARRASLEQLPLVQNLLIYQPPVALPQSFGNIQVDRIEPDYSALSAFDLTLVVEHLPQPEVRLVYSPKIFDKSTAQRILDNYCELLEQVTATPEVKLEQIAWPSRAEREYLSSWNTTAQALPPYANVEQWIREQAAVTPTAVAIEDELGSLSYRELSSAVANLARRLRIHGIQQGERVGICLSRQRMVPISILALWRIGATYVPLDATYPSARLQAMVADAGLRYVLADEPAREAVTALACEPIWLRSTEFDCLTDQCACDQCQNASKPQANANDQASVDTDTTVSANDVAYVMYTSGSTGQPKGVMIEHHSIVNLLHSFTRHLPFTANDSLLALTTISFDISVLELFMPLVCGGRLLIAEDRVAHDPDRVTGWFQRTRVTWMQGTPSTYRLLLASGLQVPTGLNVLCGGEPVSRELAKQLFDAGANVWNVYGPTETTVWSTAQQLDRNASTITIGRPIDNTTACVVTRDGQLAPIGVPGELYLGGEGVALGYLNQPELTAQRFVKSEKLAALHCSDNRSPRYYRTGDLVRWNADGTLQFMARVDRQVKVRGHRIELTEVEAAIEAHEQVAEVAVVCVEQPTGAALVAYYVPRTGGANPIEHLRESLRAWLPEYMVPSRLIVIAQMPRTPAGKIDYRALPEPELEVAPATSAYVAPRTPLEHDLCALWCEVLQRSQVGIHDNFFDLGGHSLMAAQLFSRVRERIGCEFPLRELYSRPTVALQAEWILAHQLRSVSEEDAADLLARLEQMSEDEVRNLLQADGQ